MNIFFPNKEAFNSRHELISFPVEIDGVLTMCIVSSEAIQDNFAGNDLEPLAAFRANRQAFESRARYMIEHQLFEPDGTVFIRTRDGT